MPRAERRIPVFSIRNPKSAFRNRATLHLIPYKSHLFLPNAEYRLFQSAIRDPQSAIE
ncbi:hypothetical protein D1AOALGA4SA_864 [Olavius algarvensis Delta 1 endosymbiont]|nr:hypothetical protein D1AOALGA4SA_864 [Olavius algarvensis Delta 1 endosymbiont]